MRQENIDFLNANRNCYREVSNVVGGRSAQLAHRITGELLNILREEFMPGYPPPHDCGNCLFNLVTVLYEKFDEYMAAQPKPEVIVAASFPKNEPPFDPDYAAFLAWRRGQNVVKESVISTEIYKDENGNTVWDTKTVKAETAEEKKSRLSDPNRVIKRRSKRK